MNASNSYKLYGKVPLIEKEMAEIFFRKKNCSMVKTLKIVGPIFTGALKPPSQTERTGEGAQIIDLLVNSYSIKVKVNH